jgi:hypothetical protein
MKIQVALSADKPARVRRSGWDKMNSAEKKRYAKHFPNSKFVVDALKTFAEKKKGTAKPKAKQLTRTVDAMLDMDGGKLDKSSESNKDVLNAWKQCGIKFKIVDAEGPNGDAEVELKGTKEQFDKLAELTGDDFDE